MKILKRNQIIISVLALMLITVGYVTYTANVHNTVETGALMDAEKMAGIGDAKLVNSNNTVKDTKENITDTEVEETNTTETAESGTNTEKETKADTTSASSTNDSTSSLNSTKTTSTSVYSTDYFVASRLERDKMYSQMLETYQNIAKRDTVPVDQKSTSTQEITNINNKKNSIMIAENLIKNLGFEDVVIFVNDNSTSVIIKAENLSDADIAKIQNIVCREIGVNVEDIHISLK